MVDISLRRRSAPSEWRCPWCHEGDTGEAWQLCENDETPIHASCLEEYRLCPICREDVRSEQTSARELAQHLTIRVRPRPAPSPELDLIAPRRLAAETRELIAEIRRDYRYSLNWPLVIFPGLIGLRIGIAVASLHVFLALLLALLTLAALLALHRRWSAPRVERWTQGGDPAERRQLAEDLVRGDRQALEHEQLWTSRQSGIQTFNRELKALRQRALAASQARRRSRLEARMQALREETSIADAQRIHGIGPGITTRLQSAGIHSLADFQRLARQPVRGIGPARLTMLAEWARTREAAIERLAESQVEAAVVELDAQELDSLSRLLQRAEAYQNESQRLESELARWQETRSGLLEQLKAQI